jgi:DNA-binding transcriptional regulator YiaG
MDPMELETKGGHTMSNVVNVLKAEIARISKREAKSATQGIGKSNVWLRKTVADLKKKLVLLEKENKRLVAVMKKFQEAQPEKVNTEEGKKARFTSRGIRALRKKLRLSQVDFGRLLGATGHAVYLWERKEGVLNLREGTKIALLSTRELRAKDAKQRLFELGGKFKEGRKAAAKKRKR